MLKLFDTYKKKKVLFKPVEEGKAKVYNCGPTVYNDITIGNIHKYIMDDTLRRTLEYFGYEVEQVMNITDVGHLTMTDLQKEKYKKKHGKDVEITDTEDGLDRMEKAARREGLTTWKIAQKYINKIFGKNGDKTDDDYKNGDLGKMNILRPHHLPRATEYIEQMIDFIKRLEEKGYTYTTKEAVYFDIEKFDRYEDIVGQSFQQMKRGERADVSDPDRKHPADFRLWQLNQPDHSMQWDSPWGKGYPGWHIECSAMSREILGQPFDIHTGGEDHIKVHHPAEMAQSECAYDKRMANYWLHNAFITVDGKRMGKSVGNAYILDDLIEKGFDPLDLRYFYLQSHYRTKTNFTWEALEGARNARRKLVAQVNKLKKKKRLQSKHVDDKDSKEYKTYKEELDAAFGDDLNNCRALGAIWKALADDELEDDDKLKLIYEADKVFGLKLDEVEEEKSDISNDEKEKIERLVEEREEAREKKDWKKADEIRQKLREEFGVEVKDTKKGVVWE